MNDKALVTLHIGEVHKKIWEVIFQETWEKYAKKHGYDIVIIEDYIDKSPKALARGPHWQKCMILEHPEVQRYKHAVWVDSDVLINYNTAPCIVSQVEAGKIGGVSYVQANGAIPKLKATREDRWIRMIQYFGDTDPWNLGRFPTPQEIYKLGGVDSQADDWTNTGVIVLDVEAHRDLLRGVYDTGHEQENSFWEMIPLSAAIMDSGLFQAIDTRFNVDYMYEMCEYFPFLFLGKFCEGNERALKHIRILAANVIWNNNFFIHCTGGAPGARGDARWIFRDAGEFESYLFRFND